MRKGKSRFSHKMIPVYIAACFFLFSCICAFLYVNSSEKQAGRVLKEAYTADGVWAEAQTEAVRRDLYRQKFESLTTEKGLNALKQLKLPYGLMNKGKKVDKIYGTVTNLEPVKEIVIGDISGKDQDRKQRKPRAFTYELQIEIYFDRGNEVMQPVETEEYTGTVYMRKTGPIRWRLDGLTGRRIR